jgi:hypothetical protein
MVSLLSGGIKDVKTLQSRLVATRAALSTVGDAPSRPTKVFTVATGPLHRFSPNALPLCGLGCHRNEQSGPATTCSLCKRGSSYTHSTLTEEATMMLKVRRIVAGHDEFGMGIVVSDEKLSAVPRGLGANISGCEIWSTNSMPVDNSMEAEAAQRAGFVKKYNYVGNGQGTTVRIVEWAPDTPCSRTAPRPWTIR